MALDDVLKQQEEQVDALLKQYAKLGSALKQWKKSSEEGHLANRSKFAALTAELAPLLNEQAQTLANEWNFDARAYLESDAWKRELTQEAERLGLRVLEDGETLISSPVVVRAQPGSGKMLVGKEALATIRPSLVAKKLRDLRDRAAGANSQEFVESLFGAAQYLTKEGDVFARFRDIYELFCLTPGWKKENSPAAFGQKIYALHRSEIRTTRSGKKFNIEYPSGNVKDRDLFIVIAEDGRPVKYYGIAFR